MTSSGLLDIAENIPGGVPHPSKYIGPSVEVVPLPGAGNTATEFHKYTFDWQQDYIRWLVDDQEIRRLDRRSFENGTKASDDEYVPIRFHR